MSIGLITLLRADAGSAPVGSDLTNTYIIVRPLLVNVSDGPTQPSPPASIPTDISDGVTKQDPETLREIAAFAVDLAKYQHVQVQQELGAEAVDEDELPPEAARRRPDPIAAPSDAFNKNGDYTPATAKQLPRRQLRGQHNEPEILRPLAWGLRPHKSGSRKVSDGKLEPSIRNVFDAAGEPVKSHPRIQIADRPDHSSRRGLLVVEKENCRFSRGIN